MFPKSLIEALTLIAPIDAWELSCFNSMVEFNATVGDIEWEYKWVCCNACEWLSASTESTLRNPGIRLELLLCGFEEVEPAISKINQALQILTS